MASSTLFIFLTG